MTSRRDWQLQQLGITQWSLRRPGALQGGDCHCDPGTRPSGDGGKRSSRPDRSFSERCSARINRQPRSSAATDARKKSRCCRKAVAATAGGWVLTNRYHWKALRWHHRRSPNYGQTQRHAPRYGNKFAHMNTISSLETTDLPAAYHIEQRAHAFPWSEKTFASNPGRALSQLSVNAKRQNGGVCDYASGAG